MERVSEAPQLRSLRIGEIFDRATTFYVQNFTTFTLIALTLLLPAGVLQFLLVRDEPSDFASVFARIQHPAAAQAALPPATIYATIALIVLSAFLAPFVNDAIAAGVEAIYRGKRPAYAAAFRRVLARGWPLLATILLCILLIVAVYITLIVLLALIGGMVGMIFGFRGPAAIVAMLLMMVVVLFGIGLILLSFAFACYATVLEKRSPFGAIGQAFERLFSRSEIRKAALMMLAYVALEFAVLIVLELIEMPASLWLHSVLLQSVISTAGGAVLNGFLAVLGAVYYFDVRTRAEGLDLEVDFERLPTAP